MKKFVILGIIGGILLLGTLGGFIFYHVKMSPKSQDNYPTTFKIEAGTTKKQVAKDLEAQNLIKSSLALQIYMFFNKPSIQAGSYELSPSMEPEEMVKKFQNGDVLIDSAKVTLIEGLRLTDYAEVLSKSLNFSQNEFLKTASDSEFLQTLINDYWFIGEDVLNDQLYYPLEGYLFPDTYEFVSNATPEDVITKVLDHTADILEPYKDQILNNQYNVHQLLTMASIVEKEANKEEDRMLAAQVFYTRLSENWSLGSDVTAFYGAKKEMGKDSETWDVLNGVNPYNTRLTDGTMDGKLPIGPISSPSLASIKASIMPSPTNYHYFVANTCTGDMFFFNTADEFYNKTRELSNDNCL